MLRIMVPHKTDMDCSKIMEACHLLGRNTGCYRPEQKFVWRRPHEIPLCGCLGGDKQRKLSVVFWGFVTYKVVGNLVLFDGNIDSHKYVTILEIGLWPVESKYFNGNRWISKVHLYIGQHSPKNGKKEK